MFDLRILPAYVLEPNTIPFGTRRRIAKILNCNTKMIIRIKG